MAALYCTRPLRQGVDGEFGDELTVSMCLPQPLHVGFLQVEQVVWKHILRFVVACRSNESPEAQLCDYAATNEANCVLLNSIEHMDMSGLVSVPSYSRRRAGC